MLTLNGDVGESFGHWNMGSDATLIPLLDMANIACGFHASDPEHMSKTVALCLKHNVSIGAHPGYPDLQGFGRRSMTMESNTLTQSVLYQVGALKAIAEYQEGKVSYIKPHGALYNDMMSSPEVFKAILSAAQSLNLPLMVLATREHQLYQTLAAGYGVPLIFEGFADRSYLDSGLLAPRSLENAVLHQQNQILTQADAFITGTPIKTLDGNSLTLTIDTLCVHGDNQASIDVAKALRSRLDNAIKLSGDKP
ncbi:lactam utilization protein LamB [Vibrio maritimus]|uniref:Lactam utilization protein LamB n=1 Tax=Vibrio maritimus TaxID=990268 RepID=A0A090T899_9VIBR|nr:lactam utilization protein LamB [Vibrio maritimus]